jgi:DNA-binding NarL/FixJ family response regulator
MLDQIPGFGGEWKTLTRIVLSGDHPLIRTALGALISADGLVVTGECPNEPETLRRAVGSGADLVIMDLDLDAGWVAPPEKVEHLLAAANGCPLLIVTCGGEPKAMAAALQKGVAGVVLKSSPADVLKRAVRAVLAGGSWIDRSIMSSILRPAPKEDHVVHADRLTRREGQIVELVTLGLQNKKIAERLSITETTVRHHLTSIFEKLAVTNRMELMRQAYRQRRPEASEREDRLHVIERVTERA